MGGRKHPMGLFSFLFGSDERALNPSWHRGRGFKYARLLTYNPETAQHKAGIFAVWHMGVQPEWVLIGHSTDISTAITDIKNSDDVMYYDVHGGLYISWAEMAAEYRDGAVLHLNEKLRPKLRDAAIGQTYGPDKTADPLHTLPPL
jgi:hypothetical protein